jgi:hypothetical protein
MALDYSLSGSICQRKQPVNIQNINLQKQQQQQETCEDIKRATKSVSPLSTTGFLSRWELYGKMEIGTI